LFSIYKEKTTLASFISPTSFIVQPKFSHYQDLSLRKQVRDVIN